MAAEIKTKLGKIVLQEDLIANIAGYAACENYGIVGMNSKKAKDTFIEIIKRDNHKRGIKINNIQDDTLDIDLFVTLEYGISLRAVAQNAQSNVRYRVEEMTGLKVRNVNIYVESVRV